jgi:hypothetical protein
VLVDGDWASGRLERLGCSIPGVLARRFACYVVTEARVRTLASCLAEQLLAIRFEQRFRFRLATRQIKNSCGGAAGHKVRP